jgi:hypothetical protein
MCRANIRTRTSIIDVHVRTSSGYHYLERAIASYIRRESIL